MADNLNAAVGLDTTAFRAGVTDLKNQVKAIEASFRASAAVMGDWSKSTEGLSARTTSLEEKLKLQKQALERLNTAYKEAVSQQGADSKSAQSLANQMYSMEKQIESTEQELEKYNAKLKLQQSSWEQLSQKMNTFSERASALGKGISDIGKTLTTGITTPIIGISAAAVKLGDDFEAQMSRVKAISGATGEEFKALTEQAKQLGADTAFSATEAAQGMENLASAGFTTKEIMEAMPGMLDLAASSGEDLANSADIAASTLRGFGLAASEAGHVADVLAKNAAATNAAVADTGMAMKYIAPVAKNAGWSLEEVTAAIGEMADAGIKGEQAGTTLRGALTNLMNPSKQQAKAMQRIGFSAYDANGKMKSLSQIIGELSEKTSKLTDEQRDNVIATIMGTNSLSGMQVLLKDGKTNLDKLTKSLRNSDGAAKEMAATMQDNTKGAVEQMKGALETAAISIQESLAPTITSIANKIGELADKFSQLSPAQQEMIIKFAAIAASIGPILIVIGKIAAGIGAITKVISTVSGAIAVVTTVAEAATPAVAGLASVFSFMTGPIGIAILAITAIAITFAILWNKCEGFRNFWIGLWNGIKSAAQAVGAWFSGPFKQFFQSAGNGIKSFFTGIPGFFINIWNGVKTAAMAGWNAIKSVVMAIVIPFVHAVQGPFETLKTGIANILNGLKGIFSGAWTIIKNIVLGPVLLICDLVTGNFTKLHSDLSHILTNIKNGFSSIWNGIKQYLAGVWQVISGAFGIWLEGLLSIGSTIGNSLKSFFSGLWNGIKNLAINVWNGIIAFFQGLPGKFVSSAKGIGNAIKNGFTDAINFIKSLPGKMLEWGKDMINGLINGIKSMIGNVGKAINGVADKIRSILHFSVPDEGPLTDYESWMPDFMSGLARGIESNKYKVVNAMRSLAADMAISPAITPAYVGGYSAPATVPASAATYVFYQYNNSPKALSPAETARQTRNLLRQASLQSRRR